jgi:hypothetical protein
MSSNGARISTISPSQGRFEPDYRSAASSGQVSGRRGSARPERRSRCLVRSRGSPCSPVTRFGLLRDNCCRQALCVGVNPTARSRANPPCADVPLSGRVRPPLRTCYALLLEFLANERHRAVRFARRGFAGEAGASKTPENAREAAQDLKSWLGRQDSNLGMSVPKTDALPLGDAPTGRGSYTVWGGFATVAKRCREAA